MTRLQLSATKIRRHFDGPIRSMLRAAYAVWNHGGSTGVLPVELFGEQGRYAIASTFGLFDFLPGQVGPYFQGRKNPRGDSNELTYTKGNHSSPLDEGLLEELAAELHSSPWNTTARCLFLREIVGEAWQVGAIGDCRGDGYQNYSYIHVPKDSPLGLAQLLRSHTQR